jgi:hypothetical protein
VTAYRVLGPFPIEQGQFDAELQPERTLAAPDWNAQYQGPSGKLIRWEVLPAANQPFPYFDTVKYDTERGLNPDSVAHYAAFCVETSAAQAATLQIGSDDGLKVWVNGEAVHRLYATRPLEPNQDIIKCRLKPGRNVVVCKVINVNGSGGLTVNIRASEPMELRTE